MLVPESWLREYVPGAPSIDEIEARLLITGTAVDRKESVGVPEGAQEFYRVGQVVEFDKHPDADRLRLCTVDVGEGDHERQIICGASNFVVGDKVAVVLPGGVLPDGTKIKEAKLRGVESRGMMLSERELGLSTDHAGILIAPADWKVGSPLSDYMPLGDTVLDLEITSNRPDCLSVLGVAREVAAVFDLPLADIEATDPHEDGESDVSKTVSVSVADPDLCPRYMARAFTGVTVGPSPGWLKARIARAGMRSINNVVDVTNYVMLALGQPLHAFDAEQIVDGTLTIRRATAGEKVTTLDDAERSLDPDMLVIADGSGPAVIAGVMGASHVEVTDATTKLVLEAAAFSGPSIMTTSQKLGLRSESSSRFEKGLHPELAQHALTLASQMLVELCGAKLVPGTIDECAAWPEMPEIALPRALSPRILGIDLPDSEVERILDALGFSVTATGDGWSVMVPYWRASDVTRPIDLVEEIGRVHGYDLIPFTLPNRRSVGHGLSTAQRMQRTLEDAAVGLGLHQTITYALVSPAVNDEFGIGSDLAVSMSHPMSVDQAQLRQSLTGSLLDVLRRNQASGHRDVAVFETSAVFEKGSSVDGHGRELYSIDRNVLGFSAVGTIGGGRFDRPGIEADIAAASGIAVALGQACGVLVSVIPFDDTAPAYLHPGRSGALHVGEQRIGWIGEIHPAIADAHDLRGTAVAGELDIDQLVAAASGPRRFEAFSSLPPVRQDIAVLLPDTALAADVLEAARRVGGELLENVSIFDRYVGEGVPEGHYSLALRLVFRAADRTLTDEEIVPERERIVAALGERFGAALRS